MTRAASAPQEVKTATVLAGTVLSAAALIQILQSSMNAPGSMKHKLQGSPTRRTRFAGQDGRTGGCAPQRLNAKVFDPTYIIVRGAQSPLSPRDEAR